MKKLLNWFKNRYKTISRLLRLFNTDNGMTLAGALSFYFLLSILPLSLLALSVLGYVFGSEKAALSVVTTLGKIGKTLPRGAFDIEAVLSQLISGRNVFGGLAIVLLLWFSTGVFYTIEVALNKIFATGKKRGFFQRTAVVYLMMLIAGGILVLSITITTVAVIVSDLSVSILGFNPSEIPFLWSMFFSLVPPALMMLMFSIIYKVGPSIKVSWKASFKGGLFAAVLWEISRRFFGYYLSNFAVYNKLYGALGTVVALFIWIFYTANIFLIGAEYTRISNERKERDISMHKMKQLNTED